MRAEFGEYVVKNPGRPAHFANRMRGGPLRPSVLQPMRRKRRKKHPPRGARLAMKIKRMDRAAKIAAARRWIPLNPLLAHAMWVEDMRMLRAPRR